MRLSTTLFPEFPEFASFGNLFSGDWRQLSYSWQQFPEESSFYCTFSSIFWYILQWVRNAGSGSSKFSWVFSTHHHHHPQPVKEWIDREVQLRKEQKCNWIMTISILMRYNLASYWETASLKWFPGWLFYSLFFIQSTFIQSVISILIHIDSLIIIAIRLR